MRTQLDAAAAVGEQRCAIDSRSEPCRGSPRTVGEKRERMCSMIRRPSVEHRAIDIEAGR